MRDQEEMLYYYRSELTRLRQAGQSFARKYPKLAERLELSADGSSDPHVERLIESFAFLSGRLQRRLDDDLPEVTSALLGSLFPHLVNPVPPLSIAQILPDPARGKMDTGYTVPRHTTLFSQTMEGLECRFQTSYAVTLWPLTVTAAHFESKNEYSFLVNEGRVASVLHLRVEPQRANLHDLSLESLRFYLHGDSDIRGGLYEMLFADCVKVALLNAETGTAQMLPSTAITPVGFGEEEDVIPFGNASHPAYRLLQEYFALPDKFLFFDLHGLEKRPPTGVLDILFLLKTAPNPYFHIGSENFKLGCTPIVNLFRRTSEPIRLDYTKSEYRLVPDIRRERTTEVHTVLTVRASSDPARADRVLQPIYAATASDAEQTSQAYWYARRESSERVDISGSEVFLSFVDPSFRPAMPPDQTIYAELMCTNRDLATQLQENALLQTELRAPISRILCMKKPTATAYPPIGGKSRWALISNLSLSHMSIGESPDELASFKRILLLYSLSPTPAILQQVEGLREMKVRPIVRRLGKEGWKSFCSGQEISLTFEEQCFSGGSLYLFASVISRFFGLYSAMNSFAQLVVNRSGGKGEVLRFPPVLGMHPVV